MHILFEGLDLAGKSTVCRRFAQQAAGTWAIRRNAMAKENRVQAFADELRKADALEDEALGWLYLAALRADIALLAQEPQDVGNIVQDSTILVRSLAHHTARNRTHLAEEFRSLKDLLPRFDHVFLCVADRDTRLRRLQKRRKTELSPEDFLVRDDYGRFQQMEQLVADFITGELGGTLIDTSGLENEERLSMVFRHAPHLERTSDAGTA
jgi:thymidylate kinase